MQMHVKARLLFVPAVGLLLALTGAGVAAQGTGPLVLDDAEPQFPIGLHVDYLEDPGGKLGIEDVSSQALDARFKPSGQETPNFGITDSAYWVRLHLENMSNERRDWFLVSGNARMGRIDFYFSSPDGGGWEQQSAGLYLPADTRQYLHPHFVFPFSLAPQKEALLYMRLESNLQMRVVFSVWSQGGFEEYNHELFAFLGGFYGMVVVMLAACLLMFAFSGRAAYIWCSLFILFYVLNQAVSDGTASLYLFPGASLKYGVFGFAALATACAGPFIEKSLELSRRVRWLAYVLAVVAGLVVLTFAIYPFYSRSLDVGAAAIIIFGAVGVVGGLLVLRQGVHSAGYFLLGWLTISINAFFKNATSIRLLPGYTYFDTGQYFATLLLTTFLVLGLSDQLNEFRRTAEQASDALRGSEERFRLLFEHSPLGIVIADAQARVENANRAFQDLLGYSEEELRSKSPLDLVVESRKENTREVMQKMEDAEISGYAGDTQYLRKDGVPVWASRAVWALRNKQGEVTQTFAIVADETDRVAGEQRLRESERRLREAQSMAHLGDWIWDLKHNRIDSSEEFRRLHGISLADPLTYDQLLEKVHPEDRGRFRSIVASWMVGRGDSSLQYRVVRPDGSVRHVFCTARVMRDSPESPDRLVGTAQDVTSVRQAEQEIRASEERYRAIFEHAGAGIAHMALDGSFLRLNDRFCQITGYTQEEMLGRTYEDITHPDDLEVDRERRAAVRAGDIDSFAIEKRYIRKDGSVIWVDLTASVTRNETGDPDYFIAVVDDITERKRLQQELRAYSQNLEELVASRTAELELSRAKLVILNQASQTINMAALDREQFFVAVRAAVAWLGAADMVAISLVDGQTREIEDAFLVDGNRRLPSHRRPLEGSWVGGLLADGQSLRIDDYSLRSTSDKVPPWVADCPDVRSGIAVLLRGTKETLGVLCVNSYKPSAYNAEDQAMLESFAAHAAATLENITNYQHLSRAAIIEERQRLAAELHDMVTQLLYGIALMTGGWERKARQRKSATVANQFSQIEELSLQALKEMRILIHQLRPPLLAEAGLAKALESRLDAVERRLSIVAEVSTSGTLPELPPIVESDIFLIVLEALNNSLRHAHASKVGIHLEYQAGRLRVTVKDNGRGYDAAMVSRGIGTQTMEARAAEIGATLLRESQPGHGTTVALTLPIATSSKE